MNHWIILPILLPAIVAPLLVIAVRYDLALARVFSVSSAILLLFTSLFLGVKASGGLPLTYAIGNWKPPFGIVLVLDQLSATMLLLTSVIGLTVIIYAIGNWDKRGEHFHPLMQFQLMGLNGAFLTGDLFNLFVFFEVLLIASYGLMVHGGGASRIRSGVQYVVVNLIGSTVFLIGLALIYGAAGSLNMAELYNKASQLPAGDRALFDVGVMLLWIVFGVKSAWFPLHFWLPGTYPNAPGPVAALFSIMTKVGVYSIFRVYAISEPMLKQGSWSPWIETLFLAGAALTLCVGAIGVLGSRSLGQQTSFLALSSMGIILTATIYSDTKTQVASVYYLVHSTLAIAAMFFLVDLVVRSRTGLGDALVVGQRFQHQNLLGATFFVIAASIAGLPPLSGFIGKLLMLRGLSQHATQPIFWILILVSGLITLMGLARSGSLLFWKCGSTGEADCETSNSITQTKELKTQIREFAGPISAFTILGIAMVALALFAQPMILHIENAVSQLQDTVQYSNTVLTTTGK